MIDQSYGCWAGWTDLQKFSVLRAAVWHLMPEGTSVVAADEMANEIRRDLGIKYRPPWTQGRDPDPERSKPWVR